MSMVNPSHGKSELWEAYHVKRTMWNVSFGTNELALQILLISSKFALVSLLHRGGRKTWLFLCLWVSCTHDPPISMRTRSGIDVVNAKSDGIVLPYTLQSSRSAKIKMSLYKKLKQESCQVVWCCQVIGDSSDSPEHHSSGHHIDFGLPSTIWHFLSQ